VCVCVCVWVCVCVRPIVTAMITVGLLPQYKEATSNKL